ncbi:MAG: HAMP domain-containing histidine kinase [Gomphosphaeria aponina SAG 52.96 = DSM 107014]|uniref:histidine kinase n=1 Tax=Gomphosphaeria aponina SAG 52.96 = DSM 107014 TaxID=1521640 RepID=A0A941JSQ7_9CHRO|nr:HAMP domain-containing histidine kinase [Gomphosphaeria aponina SAG 52.96 = DSM 107014]
MVTDKLLPKISYVFKYWETTENNIQQTELWYKAKAEREWFGAIASLENILLATIDTNIHQQQGLFLCGPTPVLSNIQINSHLHLGIFTPENALIPFQLTGSNQVEITCPVTMQLPLLPKDPITSEQFCLVLTPSFGLIMVLGENHTGRTAFQFSFAPETISEAWSILRSRLVLFNHHQLSKLDGIFQQFTPPTPDYRLISQFTRQLLQNLPELPLLTERKNSLRDKQKWQKVINKPSQPKEVELLQALTHEIRTPLTTIRTLTRLLLKRAKLTPDVVKHLETIDTECTEQINRMELIFRATELETQQDRDKTVKLTPICLEQMFQQSIPRWQKQAQRRNVILDVILPQTLPTVVSDPGMLDQVLTGLMEKFTRSLPNGGQIQVQVTTAGDRLKLQLLSQCTYKSTNPLKSLGQLLMFQPETGSLCLNLNVTKNLFQALGGKLTVRQHSQGEVFTIFLPLGSQQPEINPSLGNKLWEV